MIARWKWVQQDWTEKTIRKSLWSGSIISPYRLITCSHVLTSEEGHSDNDKYCLIQHDDLNNFHVSYFQLILWETLFLYEALDIAILYIPKTFYKDKHWIYKVENEYIKIDKSKKGLWKEIWILGYPWCTLTFKDWDMRLPLVWNILLRVDKWVLNSSYTNKEWNHFYEFTIQFNPWNSWWPILDVKSWKLIWIIQWYRKSINRINPLEIIKNESDWKKEIIKNIDIQYSYYSIGISTEWLGKVLEEHNIR
jgi:hypothetical protein